MSLCTSILISGFTTQPLIPQVDTIHELIVSQQEVLIISSASCIPVLLSEVFSYSFTVKTNL